jgi:hypothetical protein
MSEKAGALSETDISEDDEHFGQGLLHPVARSRLMAVPNATNIDWRCLGDLLRAVLLAYQN